MRICAVVVLFMAISAAVTAQSADSCRCSIEIVKHTEANIKALTEKDLYHFLLTFDSSCSNNAEFSEYSNELLFQVLERYPSYCVRLLTKQSQLSKGYIYSELQRPVIECGIRHIIAAVQVVDIKSQIKKEIIAALNVSDIQTMHTMPPANFSNYLSMVGGYWYEPSFMREIQKTKSPFRSRPSLPEMIELDIDTTQINGDTLFVAAPGVHEGTGFNVILRKGYTPNACPTDIGNAHKKGVFYELGYSIQNDTTLNLYEYSATKQLIHTTVYKKGTQCTDGPFQYMVNKTLFAGQYRISEEGGTGKVLFTSDGVISGLSNYVRYFVLCDFVAGPANNIDQICLEDAAGKRSWFAYSITNKTIRLFDYTENADMEPVRGKLRYTLVPLP